METPQNTTQNEVDTRMATQLHNYTTTQLHNYTTINRRINRFFVVLIVGIFMLQTIQGYSHDVIVSDNIQCTKGQNNNLLNINDIPNGSYYLRIVKDNHVLSQKLIKIHQVYYEVFYIYNCFYSNILPFVV